MTIFIEFSNFHKQHFFHLTDITNEGKRERREEMVQHSIIACPFEEKYAHTMKNTKNRNSNTKLQEKEKELKY